MPTAHPIPSDPRFIDMTGRKFHRLKVVSYAGKTGTNPLWNCICKCGNPTVSAGAKLRGGQTRSCGCFSREQLARFRTKHGKSKTLEYYVWKTMVGRCHVKTNRQYADYGGRGITVCERWRESFMNFITDMGKRPVGRFTTERRDNNKGYEPGNCYWATLKQQGRNKRNNRLLTARGKTQCLSAWAEETGMIMGTLHARIKNGWDHEDAIFTPLLQ